MPYVVEVERELLGLTDEELYQKLVQVRDKGQEGETPGCEGRGYGGRTVFQAR